MLCCIQFVRAWARARASFTCDLIGLAIGYLDLGGSFKWFNALCNRPYPFYDACYSIMEDNNSNACNANH